MISRQGVTAALPNTYKQTQGGCQYEETKKHGPNEFEQIKTPEKELNKMEISNLSDTEFKTLVIRVLKELSEDLNSCLLYTSDAADDPTLV